MLKKILIGCITAVSLYAGDINWHSYSDMNADFKAGKIDKPILLFVGATTCPYCTKEIKDMEESKDYSTFVNDNYYNVHVNQDKENIEQTFQAALTPTIYLLNPETKTYLTPSPTQGAVPVPKVLDYLQKVTKAYNHYLTSKGK